MAHRSEPGFSSHGVLRLVSVLVGVCLLGYIVGPPVYWQFAEASCPSCDCDCSSEAAFTIPSGIISSSFADCGKHDPDMREEMEKGIVDSLSEELDLQRIVANNTLEHNKALIMEARRASSHYQKEAEKCNTGISTCEEARERAEAELMEERKLSVGWEKRARELGWKDDRRIYISR